MGEMKNGAAENRTGVVMRQAVMTAPGNIEYREVPVPAAGPTELLLRVRRIGVCGSDIHVYHGLHPYTTYPVVQGHEVSAVVETAGGEVRGFVPGQMVTVMPQVFCGTCPSCRSGRYNICDNLKVMGFQTTGTASEFFAVDAEKCLVLPSSMNADEGAMVEPLAVAVHALGRLESVAGKKIAVYGAGPIGNLTAQAAKGLGAGAVLVTDTSEYRLNLARECGVDHAVNPKDTDTEEAILECFGAEKADAALECVGIEQTVGQAVANARKGSDIVIVGVFGIRPRVDLGLVQDRELRLCGTLMYTRADYLKAIELIETRKVQLQPLISAHFPFDRYAEAYRFIEENRDRAMKVLVEFE